MRFVHVEYDCVGEYGILKYCEENFSRPTEVLFGEPNRQILTLMQF